MILYHSLVLKLREMKLDFLHYSPNFSSHFYIPHLYISLGSTILHHRALSLLL
jgi:hypothetical protein